MVRVASSTRKVRNYATYFFHREQLFEDGAGMLGGAQLFLFSQPWNARLEGVTGMSERMHVDLILHN